jgi:hypothetical protein
VVLASQHSCETLICNVGAPLSVSSLTSVENHAVCCWHDGLVAVYKRTQLFAVSVWTLQLSHRIACMCTHGCPEVIVVASVGGSCSMISAADGRIIRSFSIGPIVLMTISMPTVSALVAVSRDGSITMFSIEGSAVRKSTLSLGCPLLDVHATCDGMLSVVKSNGSVQLVEIFADDFVLFDRGSLVCLKTAAMSVIEGAQHNTHLVSF